MNKIIFASITTVIIIIAGISIYYIYQYYNYNYINNRILISIEENRENNEGFIIFIPSPLLNNNASELTNNLKFKEGQGNIQVMKINNSYGLYINSSSSKIIILAEYHVNNKLYNNVSLMNISKFAYGGWKIYDSYLLKGIHIDMNIKIEFYSKGYKTVIMGTIKENGINYLKGYSISIQS